MTRPSDSIVEDIGEGDFLDSIGEEDFVLILDQSGDLKTMLLPEDHIENIPEKLIKVLNLLGVNNHNLHSRTIH